jgi:hypothetical protein
MAITSIVAYKLISLSRDHICAFVAKSIRNVATGMAEIAAHSDALTLNNDSLGNITRR